MNTASRILHVVEWYEPRDRADYARMLNAQETWKQTAAADPTFTTIKHELGAKRSSRDIGDTRQLPYLKDVFDFGCERAGDSDVICYTNSDISLTREAAKIVRDTVGARGCCYSLRVDFPYPKTQWLSMSDLRGGRKYAGADLFAFTKAWWAAHRDRMPDLLLGAEGWDFIMKALMRETDARAQLAEPIIYHQTHAAFWAQKSNLKTNPAQVYNRERCRAWATENGYSSSFCESGDYLFK